VFSLLPAQNATGNWIKIIQRIPVRIALDARELAANPLQIGLSMRAEVDTHDRHGPRLPQLVRTEAGYATEVFDDNDLTADRQVRSIILANEAAHSSGKPSVHDMARAFAPTPSPSANATERLFAVQTVSK
jgi:membrane fusion protein (multidrug efflux system)